MQPCAIKTGLTKALVNKTKRKITKEKHIYLDTSFSEMNLLRELLSRVDIWIMRLCENALKLFQLRAVEDGTDASLFALLLDPSIIRQEIMN